MRYKNDIFDVLPLDNVILKLNAACASPPIDASIEEPVQLNADDYVYNAENDSDDG